MGDLKKLHINWRIRNNGSVDLKMGGGSPFQSNFGTAKDTSQNFRLLTQCLKNSKCIPELAQDFFFFYISMYVVSGIISMNE